MKINISNFLLISATITLMIAGIFEIPSAVFTGLALLAAGGVGKMHTYLDG